jgi:hypothetical protein
MPRVIVCDRAVPVTYDVAEGCTLLGFMEDRYPETKNFPYPVVCFYAGHPVLRGEWATTALAGEDVAVFQAYPMGGGGGSNPLRIILSVVVIVLAAAATWYMGGAGGAAMAAALGVSGTTMGGIAGALVMALGTMLVNALVPNNPLASGLSGASAAEAASPTYSINSTANQPRMFQVIPEQFGRIKAIPDVVCSPWVRYERNEMYLYQVFGLGRGISRQEAMAFGDTIFWRDGKLIDSAYVTDDEPYQVSVGAEILTTAHGGGWSAPYLAAPGGIAVRTLNPKVEFPDGYCTYSFVGAHYETVTDSEGYERQEYVRGDFTPVEHVFSCEFQIREIDAAGNPLENWKHFVSGSWSLNTEAAATYEKVNGEKQAVYPAREVVLSGVAPNGYGRYELRGRNTSAYVGMITVQETIKQLGQKNPVYVERTIQAKERAVWSVTNATGSSIQVEIVTPGEKVTLFPDNVETSPSVAGQVLLAPNAEGYDWQGPFPVCPPGTVTDLISNDLTWPRGVAYFNDEGEIREITIGWEIQFQRIDDATAALGAWATLNAGSITMGTTTPQRRTLDSPVPEGRYQIRARRTTNERGDSRTMEEMQWGGLRAILPGKLTYNQSVIALRVRASNAMSQSASERFSVIQTRMLPVYNPETKTWTGSYDAQTDTWTDCVPTRSFAAAAAWICKSPWGGRLEDRDIDLDGLWAMDAIVEAKGWHYDAWVDGPYNVFALLAEVCGPMGVIPRPGGRVLTFTRDAPGRPVKHEFTPYTIIRGSFQPTWLTFSDNTPDDVSVTYLDEDAGFAKRDVRAVLPGSESKEPAQRQPIGIVSRAHAHAYGLHLAACNKFRRIELEFQTEALGRLLNVGDVVSVRHPRFRNFSSGKLEDWNAAALSLMCDPSPKIPETEGADLYISFARPDGTPWGPVRIASIGGAFVHLDPGDYAALLTQGLESPFSWLTRGYDRLPTIWSLHTSREFSRRMIIKRIAAMDMYHHTITCVNDDPRVYEQNVPVPPWEYRVQSSIPAALAAPESLTASVSGDGSLLITWLPVGGATS